MKKVFLTKLFLMFLLGILFCSPSLTNAFSVTYVATGYAATDFLTILPIPTSAIALDSDGNLYTEDATIRGSGLVTILKWDAETNYSTWSIYASYSTTAQGANGLAFDASGHLFVSEFNSDRDSGFITKIDTATRSVINTIPLPDFRPTGIDADNAEYLYLPGRLESNPDFGNIYQIDSSGHLHTLIADVLGTGIPLDASGNIFVSTPKRDVSPLISQAVYMYDSATLKPSLIAIFDDGAVEELTFDVQGNLYAIDQKNENGTQTIVRLSPLSKAMPWLMLLLDDEQN